MQNQQFPQYIPNKIPRNGVTPVYPDAPPPTPPTPPTPKPSNYNPYMKMVAFNLICMLINFILIKLFGLDKVMGAMTCVSAGLFTIAGIVMRNPKVGFFHYNIQLGITAISLASWFISLFF